MSTSGEVINRVAQSPIITFKLEEIYPEGPRMAIDLKDRLFMGLILKEKDFREWIAAHEWEQYRGAHVAIFCSADAVIPVWAYMLLATQLAPVAATVFYGTEAEMEKDLFRQALDQIDFSQFQDRPVVVKGCSDKPVPFSAYADTTARLLPFAKKISYGEPCSTVPVWKR